MGEHSHISWTDDTFNPWEGCQKVSPACDGCYAEARNLRYAPKGTDAAPNWGPGAPRRRTSASNWAKPLKWNREQAALWAAHDVEMSEWNMAGIGEHPLPAPPASRFVFCASLADVFDNAVPVEWRRDLFDLIRKTPHLTWLLLTKRPGNIVRMVQDMTPFIDEKGRDPAQHLDEWWPRNAAIGCTVVTQAEADRDIPKLLAAKAALNPAFAFISMEPLLGPVDLRFLDLTDQDRDYLDALIGERRLDGDLIEQRPKLDWVITGGETDQGQHKARPSRPDWFRSLRDQCAAAGVPYHHKQNGEWAHSEDQPPPTPGPRFFDGEGNPAGDGWHFWTDGDRGANASIKVGKKAAGRLLDGQVHDARPGAA